MDRMLAPVMYVAVAMTVAAGPAQATDAEAIARRGHQQAIELLGQGKDDASLERFAAEHLAPAYRQSFAPGKLNELLRAIRDAGAHAEGVLFARDGDASYVRFMSAGGETSVAFKVQKAVPYHILSLSIADLEASQSSVEPITWETLESRLEHEAEKGFSGSVLVVHDGQIVLSRGYGFADRAKQVPNDARTIFAVGSTPIDFTHAAILKLMDLGKVKLTDPITRFFKRVPADKQAITIDQLMSGRSGLADFHHIAGVDADPDLTWIDRDTAVKRILSNKLLFEPGANREHSHSAWVLLAAIVEQASGEAYGRAVRERLFKPAGMTRTGLHEDLANINDREIAVGYDAQSYGKVNSPKYWGRTSWLVMGSGGMYSTPEDLYKFFTAMRGTNVLSSSSSQRFGAARGVMIGGDDRGFLCMHAERSGDVFILCSNAHTGPGDHASSVGRQLAEMVLGNE